MKIFHLSEPKYGWINVMFGERPDALTLTVSDVPNDCLRDLAAATFRLLQSSSCEVVEFSLEPGFASCELHRRSDSLHLVINLPSNSNPSFNTTFPLHDFARHVGCELLRIEPHYSTQDGWTQTFPQQEIANLSQYVA